MDGKKRLGSPLDANKGKEQRMFSPDPHFRGGTGAASVTSWPQHSQLPSVGIRRELLGTHFWWTSSRWMENHSRVLCQERRL